MSLTFGATPFGTERGAFDVDIPDEVSYVEDWPRRMRAMFRGRTVVDSRGGKMLHRSGAPQTLMLPLKDFDRDLLVADEANRSWSIRVDGHHAEGAVTSAPNLSGPAGVALQGFVQLDYAVPERWFEEDEPIYAEIRDSYHRVDVRASSRHVIVRRGDDLVAESRRPKLLFETGLPVRFYLPAVDVRIDLLELSETVSECPYKGDGQYWHLTGLGGRVEDVAWSLPHPLPEGLAAAEHVCFDVEKVDVTVDGEPVTA